MVRAVVEYYTEIDHGVSGQEAVLGGLEYPLFNCRDIVLGNRTAENLVDELELGTAREGLHADPAVTELAVAAGLLFMTSLDIGFAADGFPIRDFGRLEGHVDAVAFFQTADNDLDMLLAAATQKELFGLRIAKEAQGLIFFQDAVDGVTHAVLVLPRLGFDGEGDRGFGQLDGRIFNGRTLVRQSIAGEGVLELGHGANIARVEFGDRC